MHYKIAEEETLHLEEIDPDIRTHASDSSSEAGSLSSGEGSLSSESELGTEFTSVSNFISAEGKSIYRCKEYVLISVLLIGMCVKGVHLKD